MRSARDTERQLGPPDLEEIMKVTAIREVARFV
jgi:hypothetical protein